MSLENKLSGLAEEWRRRDNSVGDKLLRIAQRGTQSVGLAPHVGIGRCKIVELTGAPATMRGFSDLVVRRADLRDVEGMCAMAEAAPGLIRGRLERGDMAYVGLIDGEILCQTWFHPGPTSFDEERRSFASWALDPGTFWSYDAMTRADARASGVFVKLFQVALREVFELPGAQRVQGFIHHTNEPSLMMHARLHFSVLGTLTAVAAGGFKWLRWEGTGGARQWLLPRDSDFALHLPPLSPPR